MLTRDFITPWVICLFDPRCSSGSDYHGHSPRIGGHGKHTSSVQAAELSGWYPLMIVISSLVERAIMIGSQAPFLPHLYSILRVVSSHWLVSKGGKVWTPGKVERCYSAATESIQGHSNNLQAESKKNGQTTFGWSDTYQTGEHPTTWHERVPSFMVRNATEFSTDKALIKEKYMYTLHAAISEDPHHP